jgi:hypothetical protein
VLHRLRILYGDAEARNILYDRGPMIVGFERAKKLCSRQPLGSISLNGGQRRKRKRGTSPKQGKDDFTKELQSVVEHISRSFGQ